MIEISNEDNMQLMARYPDNYFDLAIVDPPYGIKGNKRGLTDYKNGEVKRNGWTKKPANYKVGDWDNEPPSNEYFNELFRVSKNQIIWGANNFNLPSSNGWIVWDKQIPEDFSLSKCELAYTSFLNSIQKFTYAWSGFRQGPNGNCRETRIHPTQKPIPLYSWIIQKYVEPNFKLLDTHIGSGSIAIAVDNANKIDKMNLTLVGCELDKDYYNATMKRIKEQTSWQSLF
jgi:site-specific DNA-methyltransferase (adenine-specific)